MCVLRVISLTFQLHVLFTIALSASLPAHVDSLSGLSALLNSSLPIDLTLINPPSKCVFSLLLSHPPLLNPPLAIFPATPSSTRSPQQPCSSNSITTAPALPTYPPTARFKQPSKMCSITFGAIRAREIYPWGPKFPATSTALIV